MPASTSPDTPMRPDQPSATGQSDASATDAPESAPDDPASAPDAPMPAPVPPDASCAGASGDGMGENVDLGRLLLRGRHQTLSERTSALAAFTSTAAAGRRLLYSREVRGTTGRHVDVWDAEAGRTRRMLMFGSNNYLGLATHPQVQQAAREAVRTWGVGLSGPPLLNGYTALHRTLEERLADLKAQEDALLFSSGYGANLGLVAGLVRPHDQVLYDAESHASFCDGLRLAGARGQRFRHNDVAHLETLLARRDAAAGGECFVGVEGVYSMRGDLGPLDQLLATCRRHGALLVVDDAHGTGVMGPRGHGTAAHFGVADEVDVMMGTFSKAFGVTGGFVAAAAPIVEYMRFFARPYVFSASLPPPVVAAVHAGLDVLEREPERVRQLRENVRYVAARLQRLGIAVAPQAAIIAVPVPPAVDFQGAARHLHRRGLFVNATEFPAVPRGQQLFRISLMATHRRADLDRLVDGLEEAWTRYRRT